MNISSKSEAALRLLLLHTAFSVPRPLSSRDAASALNLSVSYLRYVSKLLTYRGHLTAVRGKGFQLGRSPAEISIASILKVTQRKAIMLQKIGSAGTGSEIERLLENKMWLADQYMTYTLLDLFADLSFQSSGMTQSKF